MAINEEVRRDYGVHQDGWEHCIGRWRNRHEATMKLIYEKQAVIDDVDIHATPHNILYKYKSKAVILCKYDQTLWEFDQLEGFSDISFVG